MQNGAPCWEAPKTISAFTSWEGRGWRWSVFYNGNQKFKMNMGKELRKCSKAFYLPKSLSHFPKGGEKVPFLLL